VQAPSCEHKRRGQHARSSQAKRLHGVKRHGVDGVDNVLPVVALESVTLEGEFSFLRLGAGVNVLYGHAALDGTEGIAWGLRGWVTVAGGGGMGARAAASLTACLLKNTQASPHATLAVVHPADASRLEFQARLSLLLDSRLRECKRGWGYMRESTTTDGRASGSSPYPLHGLYSRTI
jgi:hypothetical protein